MKLIIAAFLTALALSGSNKLLAQGGYAAPFCHVSDYGVESCFYWSLPACQNAAKSMGGFCARNPNR